MLAAMNERIGRRGALTRLFPALQDGKERARKLLGGLASSLLDASVPSVNAFLRGRFGPRASVDRVTVEGQALVLSDALLPVLDHGVLRVRRAAFEVASGQTPPLRLRSLEGVLDVREGAFVARLRFERSDAAPPNTWVHGVLTIDEATWTEGGVARHPRAPLSGSARVSVGEREWTVDSGELQAGDARVGLSARGSLEGDKSAIDEARVTLAGAHAGHFLDAVGAFVGRALSSELPLFCDFALEGEVAYAGRGDAPGARAELALRAPASSLALSAAVRDSGEIDALSLSGPLSLSDLELHPAAAARLELGDDARLDLAVSGAGTLEAPRVWGTATAKALPVRARGDKRYQPSPRLLDVTASADASRAGWMARIEAGLDGGGRVVTEVRGAPGASPTATAEVEGARAGWIAHALRIGAGKVVLGVGEGPGLRLPEDAVTSGKLALADERITGTLHASTARSSLDVEGLEVDDERARATIRGDLALHDATRTNAIPREAFAFDGGGPLHLVGVELSTDYTHLHAAGAVRAAELSVLVAGGARVPLEGVEVLGQLHAQPGGAVRAELGISTAAGTKLLVDLAASAEADLAGTRVKGKLAWRDALAAGLFATPLRPLAEEVVEVDGRVGGPADDPVLSATFAAARVRVGMPESPKIATFDLDDAHALVRVDRGGVLWHAARATAYGGRVTSSGAVAYDGALRATVVWSDVDAARVPTDSRARLLGEHVQGRFSGALRFDRAGAAPGASPAASRGRGEAVLADPVYPALARASRAFATYGLPALERAGSAPVIVPIEMDEAGFVFDDVRIETADGAIGGTVRITEEGRVSGDLELVLAEAYLRRSTVLFVPGALTGGLRVPARLEGPLDKVRVETRLADVLASLVAENKIARAVRGTAREIRDALAREPRPPPETRTGPRRRPVPPVPDLFDRLLEGDELAAEGLRRIVTEGADRAAAHAALVALDRPAPRVRVG